MFKTIFKIVSLSLFLSITAAAQYISGTVFASGQLNGTDGRHKAQGTASLVKINQKLYVTLDKGFQVTEGPDLFLMLRNSKYPSIGMPILTPLKQYAGPQMYQISLSEEDIANYDQLIIYCKRFSSLFAVANLVFYNARFTQRYN